MGDHFSKIGIPSQATRFYEPANGHVVGWLEVAVGKGSERGYEGTLRRTENSGYERGNVPQLALGSRSAAEY